MTFISPEELHFGFDEDLSHFPGFHPGACILVVVIYDVLSLPTVSNTLTDPM